jgi:hypothetical protein
MRVGSMKVESGESGEEVESGVERVGEIVSLHRIERSGAAARAD